MRRPSHCWWLFACEEVEARPSAHDNGMLCASEETVVSLREDSPLFVIRQWCRSLIDMLDGLWQCLGSCFMLNDAVEAQWRMVVSFCSHIQSCATTEVAGK